MTDLSHSSHSNHLTDTFVFKNSYKVRWTRLGDSANPPVLLVHGFPFSSLEWLPCARALQKDYNVYIWDWPGFGASQELTSSSIGTSAVSFSAHGELFSALYSHWGFSSANRPHVVATDIGGHATLRAHLIHGNQFASLCLLDILAVTPWGSPFLRAVMQNPEAFEAVPLAMFTGLLREYVQLAAYKKLTEATMSGFIDPWMGEAGKKRFLSQIAQFDQKHTEEMEADYHRVMASEGGGPKKLKIIWAENDELIPVRKGEELARMTGAREFVRVPEAGHLVMLDQPEVVTYELAKWLRQVV